MELPMWVIPVTPIVGLIVGAIVGHIIYIRSRRND